MSDPIVTAPGAGEVVGDAPDRRVEILSDHDALAATWSRFGPRRAGADLHVHRRHSDLFYVLAGTLNVQLGPEGEDVPVPAGSLARVPPLVVHGFRNGGDRELRYLNLHAPGRGFAGYMRALRDGRAPAFDQEPPPADGGRPAAEAVIGGDGFDGGRVMLLADIEAIGIAAVWSHPGDDPPPSPHRHGDHLESLYVLEGELALTSGDRELRAPAGSWVQVPPGVEHGISAPGPEPVHLLDVHTPNCGFGPFLRALHEAGATARPGVALSYSRSQPK
jgi:mannose-6-phosphate isomerase-like protein (cupin superfamily)